MCGYLTNEQLTEDSQGLHAIVSYTAEELGVIVEKVACVEASQHFLHYPDNEKTEHFLQELKGNEAVDGGVGGVGA